VSTPTNPSIDVFSLESQEIPTITTPNFQTATSKVTPIITTKRKRTKSISNTITSENSNGTIEYCHPMFKNSFDISNDDILDEGSKRTRTKSKKFDY
jgi:hypothetical protein